MGFPSPAADYEEMRISLDENSLSIRRLRILCGLQTPVIGRVFYKVLFSSSMHHLSHAMALCLYVQWLGSSESSATGWCQNLILRT